MPNIMNIGLSGLLASQSAIATAGHNVANANTPGYSRQRVDLSSAIPQLQGGGYIGRGVEIDNVTRVYNDFLSQQVLRHTAGHGEAEAADQMMRQLATVLGDAENGVSAGVDRFFAAVQELASDPGSGAVREVLLGQARGLADQLRSSNAQLRDSVNRSLVDEVNTINEIARSLAEINDAVVSAASAGHSPNDLLDQRDELLGKLAEHIAVQTVAQDDGSTNVFIGKGQPLAIGAQPFTLEVSRSTIDPQAIQIRQLGQSAGSDVSGLLIGGRVGGLLEFRDGALDRAQGHFGLMATGLAETFNAQHAQGLDLNGDLGGVFFRSSEPRTVANANNTGSAALSASIRDAGQLTASDYELRFDGSTFSLLRLSDKTVVASGAAGPLDADGFRVEIASGTAAAGDRFLIQPARGGAAKLELALDHTAQIAAAVPVRAAVATTNVGNGSISPGRVVDITDPALRNSVELRFTSASAFDVVDLTSGTTLASGQSYSAGDTIDFNGWEVEIEGAPAAGDVFTVTDNTGGRGDNRNILALGELQSASTLLDGSVSLQGLYGQLISDVGARASRFESALHAQKGLLEQAENLRAAVSGVSLDEEAANLMRFQQSYQASAQVIRTADSLFQTLLNAVGR